MHMGNTLLAGSVASVLGGTAVLLTQPAGHYLANHFHNPDLAYLPITVVGLLVFGAGITYVSKFMRQ